jgi:transcription initiation factor TFIIB
MTDRFILPNIITCPNHSSADLIEDSDVGDTSCSDCRLVVEDRAVDVGTKWRPFSNDKSGADPSCVDDPEIALFGSGDMSTMIRPTGSGSFDELGNARYNNRRQMRSSDRALMKAVREISAMADKMNLPLNIVNRANGIFKEVYHGKPVAEKKPSSVIDSIVSACVYVACRQEGVPRTFKEICASSNGTRKRISREFRFIQDCLQTNTNLITTGDFIARLCNDLALPYSVPQAAKHIVDKAVELDIVPGRPSVFVAAAAIYMVCQASENPCSMEDIVEAACVGEATIRRDYQLLLTSASLVFPADFNFAISIKDLPRR